MIKIIRGRDTGKTKELLEECSKVNGLFVCKHPERVDAKCEAYGIEPVRTVRYDTLEAFDCFEDEVLFIDDLEEFVKFQYNDKLGGFTLTMED